MARPKKPKYTYLEDKKRYQKKIRDADGKYFALYGKTPEELTEKIEEAERQIAAAKYSRANPTVAQYAARWQELNLDGTALKTRDTYAYIINSYILPVIGHRRLSEITQDDCKAVMKTMSKMSSSAYNKAVVLMKRIFESAVDNHYISSNPARKLKTGGVAAKEKDALTKEQQAVLLDAVYGTVAETFVNVVLYTGLRREEALGLKWDCVELDGPAPHIRVRRALRWEHNQPILNEELKSKAARRDIPIPPALVACLREAKKTSKGDFVISNTTGGPKSQIQFKNMWRAIDSRSTGTYLGMLGGKETLLEKKLGAKCPRHDYCYTIDFDVTPHQLRHTYITNLILAGVNIKTVQYLAGHADPKITLKIYTHLTENQPQNLMAEVMKAYA